jgi:hypothetical protein
MFYGSRCALPVSANVVLRRRLTTCRGGALGWLDFREFRLEDSSDNTGENDKNKNSVPAASDFANSESIGLLRDDTEASVVVRRSVKRS